MAAASNVQIYVEWRLYRAGYGSSVVAVMDALEGARQRGLARTQVSAFMRQINDAEDNDDRLEELYLELASWAPKGATPAGSPLANADQGFKESVSNFVKYDADGAFRDAKNALSTTAKDYASSAASKVPTAVYVVAGVALVGVVALVVLPPLFQVAVNVKELTR